MTLDELKKVMKEAAGGPWEESAAIEFAKTACITIPDLITRIERALDIGHAHEAGRGISYADDVIGDMLNALEGASHD